MKNFLKTNILFLSILLVGCQRGGGSTTKTEDISSASKTTTATSVSSTTETSTITTTESTSSIETKVVDINLCGTEFGTSFSSGTQFDNETQVNNLVKFINDQLPEKIVSSVECINCKSYTAKEGNLSSTYFNMGSQSTSGIFNLNFLKRIIEVKVTAQAYYKYYYNGGTGEYAYNVDTEAALTIEGTEYSFNAEAGKESTPIEYALKFDSAKYSLDMENVDEANRRVFLNSITVTYKA